MVCQRWGCVMRKTLRTHLEISSGKIHTHTWKISGDLEIYRTWKNPGPLEIYRAPGLFQVSWKFPGGYLNSHWTSSATLTTILTFFVTDKWQVIAFAILATFQSKLHKLIAHRCTQRNMKQGKCTNINDNMTNINVNQSTHGHDPSSALLFLRL